MKKRLRHGWGAWQTLSHIQRARPSRAQALAGYLPREEDMAKGQMKKEKHNKPKLSAKEKKQKKKEKLLAKQASGPVL